MEASPSSLRSRAAPIRYQSVACTAATAGSFISKHQHRTPSAVAESDCISYQWESFSSAKPLVSLSISQEVLEPEHKADRCAILVKVAIVRYA
eukprot:scaffold24_cov128-Cylindrotheca_fusiformis.AAC.4